MTRRIDWLLVTAVVGLVGFSTMLVWSASQPDPQTWVGRQLVAAMIGLGLMVLIWGADSRLIKVAVPIGYAVTLGLLLAVLTHGSVVNGSKSWLMIGSMSVQPSEFAKLAVICMIALVAAHAARVPVRRPSSAGVPSHLKVAARRAGIVLGRHPVPVMLAVAGLPAVLVLAQPDLGTLLILALVVFATLVAAGAPKTWLVVLVAGAGSAAWFAVSSGLLAQYQIDRLLAFLDPTLDPKGAGYNVTQSRIAVGNGGLWGEGLFHGSQTQAGFVPEQHTDFIFTVAAEELGLAGAGLLVLLIGIVVWRALRIARGADDMFGRVAGIGIGCWIGVQAFWNVGMCLGIMPVTGVPLPLVSYGGTAMIATLVAVGVLLNIHASRLVPPGQRPSPAEPLREPVRVRPTSLV